MSLPSNAFTVDSIAIENGLPYAEEEELRELRLHGCHMTGMNWLKVLCREVYDEDTNDGGSKMDEMLRMIPQDDPLRDLIVEVRQPFVITIEEARRNMHAARVACCALENKGSATEKELRFAKGLLENAREVVQREMVIGHRLPKKDRVRPLSVTFEDTVPRVTVDLDESDRMSNV